MYCKACSDKVSYGDELRDENGRIQPHTYQVCGKCRPKNNMSEREVSQFLAEKIEEQKIKNPIQV